MVLSTHSFFLFFFFVRKLGGGVEGEDVETFSKNAFEFRELRIVGGG